MPDGLKNTRLGVWYPSRFLGLLFNRYIVVSIFCCVIVVKFLFLGECCRIIPLLFVSGPQDAQGETK